MPPLIWAFFIAVGLAGGSALVGPPAAWAPPDPTARSAGIGKTPVSYYATTSVPWVALASLDWDGRENCRITVTAWVTGGRPTRVRIGGVEQNLDTGWSVPMTLEPSKQYTIQVTFVNPIGGAVLAKRPVVVSCVAGTVAPSRDNVLYDERGLRGYEAPPMCPCPEEGR